ncbi:CpaE family protein [Pseudoduganella sp. GCM10020061]|uniref:AAA family ATPase n=1 Tax=Pseudoduganella sp. GCM10020061 TaxID=3317345 RepID=UPI00363FE258
MKIALVSPSRQNLDEMAQVLKAHSPVLLQGGKTRMREIVETEGPDIMIVEGMCCDIAELAHVEYITTHFPRTAVVLVCASATPEFLINSMRAGVREVLTSPVTPPALFAAVERIGAKVVAVAKSHNADVLAFLPCKGGSGATFLATNLGAQLAETRSVMLIDLNLQFGDALSFVYDSAPASTIADVAREIDRLDASFLTASAVKISDNFSILAAPEDPAQAIEIKPEHVDAIIELAALHFDYVLLDLPRHIDTIGVKALDRATKLYPVLQASLPAIRNTKKILAVFKTLGYQADKLELIINRFERTGEIGIPEIERSLGKYPIHTVPNSYKQVNAAINHGDPLLVSARSNPVSKNLAEFARSISPQLEHAPGLFQRLLGRQGQPVRAVRA